jgi:nucleoside-diphosphate-sugar epimerase
MRVLITGHQGYIGSVLAPRLRDAGHDCVGLDTGYFAACRVADIAEIPTIRKDVRLVEPADLEGFDAVIHLAGLSNDPLGSLDASLTDDINLEASVRLARFAQRAGVQRFVFASSCSLYGASGGEAVDETAPLAPLTPYAEAKARFEKELGAMEDGGFVPVILRNATVHGWSPRLRGDLVVHNLLASALSTGQVLIKSDGTPWRPLVHVADVAGAFQASVEAPDVEVRGAVLNVGASTENYQVRDIAEVVAAAVPGSRVEYAPGGEPDTRDYRVDFSRVGRVLTEWTPRWTLERSVADLYQRFQSHGVTLELIEGPTCNRLGRITSLLRSAHLDPELRWTAPDPEVEHEVP